MIPSSYERKVPPVSLLCWSCSSSLSFATLEWLQIMLAMVHREPPRARDHGDFARIRRSCIQILCIHVRPTSPTARGSMGANCGTPIGHCNCTMDTPIRFGRMRPRDTTPGLTILRICTSDTVFNLSEFDALTLGKSDSRPPALSTGAGESDLSSSGDSDLSR